MATTNNGLDPSRNVEASDEGKEEESASDVFVKFLMSQNISVDVSKDSNFQTLLKSVAQQGHQSCLFLENSTVIQNSLWRYEHEIKEYMRIVLGSWETTGCTLMSYNVKGPLQNNRVLGFYCPKGFIFLEGGQSEQQVWNALADLVPDSRYFLNRVVQYVRHDRSYHSECQYQALDVTGMDQYSLYYTDIKCIRQQVHVFWRSICKTSKWVQSLVKKSDEIFECMVTSDLSEVFYNTLKQKGVEHVAGWKNASSFARLRMVMKVRSELTAWLSNLCKYDRFHLQNDTDVMTIINNSEFWNGNQLVRVLTPFYKIASLMDTLVPTAGYLELEIDKASGLLKTHSESEPLKYKQIWECFQIWRFDDCVHPFQDLACYLNPCYYMLGQDVKKNIMEDLAMWLYDLVQAIEVEDQKAVDAEIDAYCTKSSNPFAGVSVSEFEANHPITLWSKYGGGFPLLQKCAYILLSQPACCLCKQVEKHASKLQGSDNFILRLNGLMMEEFTKLGDQIYQPILI